MHAAITALPSSLGLLNSLPNQVACTPGGGGFLFWIMSKKDRIDAALDRLDLLLTEADWPEDEDWFQRLRQMSLNVQEIRKANDEKIIDSH